jgi:DNA repair exonuclease SbcCD ATPase subunit
MISPKIIGGVGVVGLAMWLGYQSYSDWSSRQAMDTRLAQLENHIQKMHDDDASKITELSTTMDAVQQRVGVTAADIANAQKAAAAARKEQAKTEAALKQQLEEHAKNVDTLREQADAKLQAVRDQTTNQFGEVNGQVATVKGDLDATRSDVAANLATSRREMGDLRDSLGRQIAHNSDELAQLRRKGERDYYEFDIRKTKDMERVAGIRLQLNKTDIKTRRYDVTLQVDDNKLQKKGQLMNEPIQLNVGKDRVRYELVVNSIDKDRIRGYISTPKDSVGSSSVAFKN